MMPVASLLSKDAEVKRGTEAAAFPYAGTRDREWDHCVTAMATVAASALVMPPKGWEGRGIMCGGIG